MIKGVMVSSPNEVLRFSGHETFACRYAWLPKAYRAIKADAAVFVDEQAAMVDLGIGKNMVRSLRFWVEATGLAEPANRELRLTDFAHAIFGSKGFDPYLEDIRTLWLLHWKLSSRRKGGLFAWRFLLNHWPYPELTRSEALSAFARESAKLGYVKQIGESEQWRSASAEPSGFATCRALMREHVRWPRADDDYDGPSDPSVLLNELRKAALARHRQHVGNVHRSYGGGLA
jgi:Protein of unknown function (DUF4007)